MKRNNNRLYGHELEMIDDILEQEQKDKVKRKKMHNARKRRKKE